MNRTLSLVALCVGSAAVGGFIAVRLVGHAQPLKVAPAPEVAASATPSVTSAPLSRVAVSPPDRTAQAVAAATPTPPAVGTRDDYDFESLAGPSKALAHRFDSEGPDPGWASRAIDNVSHELEGQPVYSQLSSVDVDCRATLCRIQATLPLEALQAMGPNANFSWGGIISKLVQVPPWSTEFDNISDEESMDNRLGQAQFTTYLHRRPQGVANGSRTAS